jgi:hypothetical protein
MARTTPKQVSIRHAGEEITVTYGRALALSRRFWIVTDGDNAVWRMSKRAPGSWAELKEKAGA